MYKISAWTNIAIAICWCLALTWGVFALLGITSVTSLWMCVIAFGVYGVWPIALLVGSALALREKAVRTMAVLTLSGSIALIVIAVGVVNEAMHPQPLVMAADWRFVGIFPCVATLSAAATTFLVYSGIGDIFRRGAIARA